MYRGSCLPFHAMYLFLLSLAVHGVSPAILLFRNFMIIICVGMKKLKVCHFNVIKGAICILLYLDFFWMFILATSFINRKIDARHH